MNTSRSVIPNGSATVGENCTHVVTVPACAVVTVFWPQVTSAGSVAWSGHGDPFGCGGRKLLARSWPVKVAVGFDELTVSAGGVAAEAAVARASAIVASPVDRQR